MLFPVAKTDLAQVMLFHQLGHLPHFFNVRQTISVDLGHFRPFFARDGLRPSRCSHSSLLVDGRRAPVMPENFSRTIITNLCETTSFGGIIALNTGTVKRFDSIPRTRLLSRSPKSCGVIT